MIQIALDGPSGAGKSTLAKMLAAELSFVYVDTGALYRAVGLYASEKGLEKSDTAGIIACLPEIQLTLRYVDGSQRVFLGDRDVSEDIRLPEISMWASTVSAIPEVRAFLLDLQKDIAEKNNVIMDGRDIGTVILPHATVKIFLDSSSEARAKRRYRELCEKGIETSYDEVLADMIRRDENDRNRATAPLKKAEDAVLLDNSDLNLKESYEAALRIIRDKIG
ncbi:MAG: (d)CMP kinase [Eubacteriales bacterium]